jgi:hypothetical protein
MPPYNFRVSHLYCPTVILHLADVTFLSTMMAVMVIISIGRLPLQYVPKISHYFLIFSIQKLSLCGCCGSGLRFLKIDMLMQYFEE